MSRPGFDTILQLINLMIDDLLSPDESACVQQEEPHPGDATGDAAGGVTAGDGSSRGLGGGVGSGSGGAAAGFWSGVRAIRRGAGGGRDGSHMIQDL